MTLSTTLSPQKKIFIRAALGGGIVLLLLGLYLLLRSEEDPKRDFRAAKVEVEEVRVGSLTRTVTAVGTLRANQMVTLRPEISGLIAHIHVRGGEYVNEGDPLFALEDKLFKAEMKDAEAKLALARVQHKRATRLEANKFGSTANKDKAVADLNVAEALVESAQSKLARTVIKAPFDGIVGLHTLSIGAPVDQNKELITLVDVTPMKVDFKTPAKYLRYISIGQRVKVAVDGFQEKKFPGLIEGIDATVDPNAHSIGARALIPNKGHLLKPGLFARVDLTVGAKNKALIVPAIAVDKLGDQEFVYKIAEGRAFQTPVVTGIQEGDNIEILRGVKPGDHIVTVGQLKLQDGSPVRYELDGKIFSHNQELEDKKIAALKAQKEKKLQEEETKKEIVVEESKEEEKKDIADAKDAPAEADTKVADVKDEDAKNIPTKADVKAGDLRSEDVKDTPAEADTKVADVKDEALQKKEQKETPAQAEEKDQKVQKVLPEQADPVTPSPKKASASEENSSSQTHKETVPSPKATGDLETSVEETPPSSAEKKVDKGV